MSAAALDPLIRRCTFPASGTSVSCAFSGGPDSSALVALAHHAGLDVTAHHVDHGIRAESAAEAEHAHRIAAQLGVEFRLHHITVEPGPNLEARARHARRSVLPDDAMTGHTADDQAETVVIRLVRGSGSTGLGAMTPGTTHPLLRLRRTDTEAVCDTLGIDPVHDRSNQHPDVWRNRIRAAVLPLLDDIAGRDVVPILARTADILRDEAAFLDELAAEIDPTDARAVSAAPPVLARRTLRHWLLEHGYPPDAASIDRVLEVADGSAIACELPGGRRVERSEQRLRIVEPGGSRSD